jgi:uncharacterized metal-binding protein
MSSCCCGGETKKKNVLLYACSGGANVAEMADRAARQLMREGRGAMYCLAGLGADIPNMVQQAKDADLNLVIDGCSVDCARKIFERHGLKNVQYVRVTDLGIEKKKGVPVTDAEMEKVLAKCRDVLGVRP